MSVLKSFALAVVSAIVICSPALAEDDPPARAARLNYISGQVSLQPGGVNDWVAASINRPLTSSDRIWVDKDSRAEVQMGSASIRMDENTSMMLVNVLDNNVQIRLDEGTLNLHVTELFDGEIYAVDTPNIQFVVRKRGTYRFDVDNAADKTDVTVFSGEGDVTGDGPAIRVKKASRYTFTNERSLQYAANHNPGRDGFDDWCFVRADREDRSESARYVSRYAVGYSDLDDNGYWETAPTYGRIWIPRGVAVGWAPYRYGHWVWVSPWGWTWVDDAPWGFAPFHYGRWVRYRNNWGWCPGPIHVRPYYAPALVAWVGGHNWGVGLSFGVGGGVGWFPLGWGDPYIPYYRHSRGYFRNVNVSNTRITNITHITNNYYNNRGDVRNIHYHNRNIEGAVTAVSHNDFRSGHPTRGRFVNVSARDMQHAEIEREVRVRPTTNSVLGANAGQKHTEPLLWRTNRGNDRMGNDGQRGPSKTADRVAGNDRPQPGRPTSGLRPGREMTEASPSAKVPSNNPRTDRPTPGVRPGREIGEAYGNRESPMHNVPRPPERGGAVATAEVERPKDIPRPGKRVSDGDSRGAGNDTATRIPRPQEGQVIRPERHNDPVGNVERPSTPRSSEPRNTEPRSIEPRSVPRPAEGQVIRQDRRSDDPPRTYSAPSRDERIGSRSQPQRTNTPPPARESNGPSRSERKVYEAPRVERSSPRNEPRSNSGSMRSAPAPQRSAEPSRSSAPSHQSGSSNSDRSSGSHESRTQKGERN
jgi:Family of unknown function (DUF6600)/FecR protein